MKNVWVDYNDIDNGCVATLERFADNNLSEGETVLTYDNDGNTCEGKISFIAGNLVMIELNYETMEGK